MIGDEQMILVGHVNERRSFRKVRCPERMR